MEKPLIGNGRVRLTEVSDQYYLEGDDTPTIKDGEVAVTFDSCHGAYSEDYALYCALEDVQPLQAFLRSTRRRTTELESFDVTTASAGLSGHSCTICDEAFTGDRRADGLTYYMNQYTQDRNCRTASFHVACADKLVDALDDVWMMSDKLLGQAL